ncbi:MAG: hypothetical protein MUC83_17275 [Pirellula sp.]|nr:hypothetical protein [Pirellula sp.]
MLKKLLLLFFYHSLVINTFAQIKQDTIPKSTEEEDYSQYENVTFTDPSAKRFCSPKIFDLSPQRFISIGWDMQMPYKAEISPFGQYVDGDDAPIAESATVNYTGGVRLGANIPVLSNNKILINVGGSYVESNYSFGGDSLFNPLLTAANRGLKALQLNTTIFKPLNEKNYILAFLQGDYSGDYSFSNMQSLSFTKLTWVGVYGWKFNDRFQFGIGATGFGLFEYGA